VTIAHARKPEVMGINVSEGLEHAKSRIFPDSALEYAGGEKSPVRGFHALMLAGTPQPVSSGLAGCGPGAAGAGAIPGVTAARLHSQPGRSRPVTAVGVPSNQRLTALISAPGRPPAQTEDTGGSGRTGVGTRYPPARPRHL
jgi:hypothetical protein